MDTPILGVEGNAFHREARRTARTSAGSLSKRAASSGWVGDDIETSFHVEKCDGMKDQAVCKQRELIRVVGWLEVECAGRRTSSRRRACALRPVGGGRHPGYLFIRAESPPRPPKPIWVQRQKTEKKNWLQKKRSTELQSKFLSGPCSFPLCTIATHPRQPRPPPPANSAQEHPRPKERTEDARHC